jgi:hypothetical protein
MSDPAGTGTGKDLTSAPRTYVPEEDVPAAGDGRLGAPDPVEAADPKGLDLDDVEQVERTSAFYGAGEAVAEVPETAPFSSERFPASSAATGATHVGDRVTGIEDGPSEGLDDTTRDQPRS